jgi:hypothetical protein
MKTISIKAPWCQMIASGQKTIEVRTWKTDHRGPMLVASSASPKWERAGMAVCTVNLVDIRPLTLKDSRAAGFEIDDDCLPAYAWVLADVRQVKPFPIKGRLHLYDTPDDRIAC